MVLILGSGEQVDVECQGCGGYEGPRGRVSVNRPLSGVTVATVCGVEFRSGSDQWYFSVGSSSKHRADEVCGDPECAESRRLVLHAEAEAQAVRNFESQFKATRKSHSWTVRYHRDEIAKLERSLAWHRSKLEKK